MTGVVFAHLAKRHEIEQLGADKEEEKKAPSGKATASKKKPNTDESKGIVAQATPTRQTRTTLKQATVEIPDFGDVAMLAKGNSIVVQEKETTATVHYT